MLSMSHSDSGLPDRSDNPARSPGPACSSSTAHSSRTVSGGSELGTRLFPETVTGVLRMIDDEEYQRLADHIMHVYCRPLVLYFLRTSLRRVGNLLQGHSMNEKAYEFVSGFFESRLTRRDYFDNWRKSGRRLHEYLISGLFYYKKELCRNSSRKAMVEMAEDPIIEEESGGSIDRDRAVELMRRAVSLALAEVKGSSLEEHVEMFVTRTCRGLSHKGSAEMFSADVERARRMFRTGKERVERCFRKVLAQEGVEHIDREICDLKEVINS